SLRTDVRGIPRRPSGRLIRTNRAPAEDRHYDQPAMRQLIVTNDRVSVVAGIAGAAEALEHRVRRHRTQQHLARLVVRLPLLREYREPAVHDLYDVIGAHCQAVVRRVPQIRGPLWTFETDSEPIETFDQRRCLAIPLRLLFDRRATGRYRWRLIRCGRSA